jgi:hypothetical protein
MAGQFSRVTTGGFQAPLLIDAMTANAIASRRVIILILSTVETSKRMEPLSSSTEPPRELIVAESL